MDCLREELEVVYRDCSAALLRHLMYFDADQAADILQETFVRYLLYRRRGGRAQRPLQFLFRTATRLAYKQMKKQSRRHALSHRLPQPNQPDDPDARLGVQRTLESIWPRLDLKGRLVAKALLVDEMKIDEIASLASFSRSTVRRRIAQIKRMVQRSAELRTHLEKIEPNRPAGSS